MPLDAQALRRRLFDPPNAVKDTGINLLRDKPKGEKGPPPPAPTPAPIKRKSLPAKPRPSRAKQRVKFRVPSTIPNPITVWNVIGFVAEAYNVPDILARRRHHDVVIPRQVAMWLAMRVTKRNRCEIGRRMGGMDHTTVICAENSVNARAARDAVFAEQLRLLTAALQPPEAT